MDCTVYLWRRDIFVAIYFIAYPLEQSPSFCRVDLCYCPNYLFNFFRRTTESYVLGRHICNRGWSLSYDCGPILSVIAIVLCLNLFLRMPPLLSWEQRYFFPCIILVIKSLMR